jgi:ketosteroid isomerase-like protein
MSQENVEIVREVFDRLNRDGALPEELFDPAVEVANFRESPVPGPYKGYVGLRRWRDDLFEVIVEGQLEVEDLRDAHPAEAVAARVRLRGRAAHTDLDFDVPFAMAIFIRDKRIYRTRSYTDYAEALEAAGLSE